jgi:flagellar motor switch protein FliN
VADAAGDVMNATAKWALDEFASGFASSVEGMAFVRPEVRSELLAAAPAEPGVPVFRWKQLLSGLSGEAFATVSEPDMLAIGQFVMAAAGVEESSPEELKATYRECVGQAFSVLARAMTGRLQREVTVGLGVEVQSVSDAVWGKLQVQLGDQAVTILLGLQTQLLEQFTVAPKAVAQAAGVGAPASSPPAAVAPRSPAEESKTFDLLLDVELPVSVSFGHAQVPLKDVLKLTTGSIVELSRAVVEPVDIVVNNCVIAKGEVVVVEGNFGVRIQQVISRSDRLRSFQ